MIIFMFPPKRALVKFSPAQLRVLLLSTAWRKRRSAWRVSMTINSRPSNLLGCPCSQRVCLLPWSAPCCYAYTSTWTLSQSLYTPSLSAEGLASDLTERIHTIRQEFVSCPQPSRSPERQASYSASCVKRCTLARCLLPSQDRRWNFLRGPLHSSLLVPSQQHLNGSGLFHLKSTLLPHRSLFLFSSW